MMKRLMNQLLTQSLQLVTPSSQIDLAHPTWQNSSGGNLTVICIAVFVATAEV